MPTNTKYDPTNVNSLVKEKLKRNDDAICGSATANTTTNFDLCVSSDDHLLLGGEIIVKDGGQGDYLTFKVIDIDNVMGAGAGTVLDTFIRKRYIAPTSYLSSISSRFPAKVPAGLYLRVSYISVNNTTPFVAINYDLTKVLV
jgi:hypothetical protein